MLEFCKQILKQQPFSQLLGAQLNAFEEGSAELVLPVVDALKSTVN